MNAYRIILIFLALTFLRVEVAQAIEFEADMIVTSGNEQFISHVAFARSGNKVKMRTEMKQDGQQAITIMRTDKDVVWVVMPSERMYIENRLDRSKYQLPEIEKKPDMKFLRNETIDGHPCAVYEYREKGEVKKREGVRGVGEEGEWEIYGGGGYRECVTRCGIFLCV